MLPLGNDIGRNRANCAEGDAWESEDGNECGDSWEYTAPVGSFAANGFGLHDMHGNVWEWVEDCWNPNYAWESGKCDMRILRGGSWGDLPGVLRAADRGRSVAGDRDGDIGFRVSRTLAR